MQNLLQLFQQNTSILYSLNLSSECRPNILFLTSDETKTGSYSKLYEVLSSLSEVIVIQATQSILDGTPEVPIPALFIGVSGASWLTAGKYLTATYCIVIPGHTEI